MIDDHMPFTRSNTRRTGSSTGPAQSTVIGESVQTVCEVEMWRAEVPAVREAPAMRGFVSEGKSVNG